MTDHTKYFELDMTEPDDAADAPRPAEDAGGRLRFRRLGPSVRRRGAIAAALIVGLALGAFGVDKERDDAADRASRGAVSLAAVLVGLGPTSPSNGRDVTVHLRLYNAGQQPVEVAQAMIIGSAYLAPHHAATDRTVAKSRQWTALTAVAGRPDCDTVAVGLRALGPPILQVTARTVNGRERIVGVPLVDPYDLLSSARDHHCPGPGAGAGSVAGFRTDSPAAVRRRGGPTGHAKKSTTRNQWLRLEVVRCMPESGRMHRKAEKEAASGANDDDNAARRRPSPADTVQSLQA